jgi:hypothetical protein
LTTDNLLLVILCLGSIDRSIRLGDGHATPSSQKRSRNYVIGNSPPFMLRVPPWEVEQEIRRKFQCFAQNALHRERSRWFALLDDPNYNLQTTSDGFGFSRLGSSHLRRYSHHLDDEACTAFPSHWFNKISLFEVRGCEVRVQFDCSTI